MPFTIVRQDITKIAVDAIVNAANTSLQKGGGVCGAVFAAAGTRELEEACSGLAPIAVGEAVITPGFDLPAKFVIHTAGPVYRDGAGEEREKLRSCYLESLKLAVENNCESIAFPLISSGVYGYPKKEALQVAMGAIQEFLQDHDLHVYLAVFDTEAFTVSKELLGAVASYLDENYVEEDVQERRRMRNLLTVEKEAMLFSSSVSETMTRRPLETLVGDLDEPFSATLLRLIDAKEKDDVEVYKKANLDRRLFSKIRCNKGYVPSKRTVLALAVGLELSLDETNDLLGRAGFALSRSQVFDVIVEYFIINGKYDVLDINEVLFRYDQPLLGGA
ncbi:MAG: macro domain-containing protein [Limnochordia bacterium]|jgi:O-acetyl-ADP-ribose deacetylase (regulator of RNase III)|nr:macro domain-containing protein [Limnochordia bacterium]